MLEKLRVDRSGSRSAIGSAAGSPLDVSWPEGRFQARRSWGAPRLNALVRAVLASARRGAHSRVLALVWGWFEAGWLRTRVLEVPVAGLPAELDGLRIAHLSDFHLGPPSRGSVAVRRAATGCASARPDLVVRDRRPALAPARARRARRDARAASTLFACSATTTSRSRAIRSRAPRRSTGSRRRCSGRVADGRAARPARSSSPASTRPHRGRGAARPTETRALRILLSHFPRLTAPGATSSSSPATCTRARSCCRTRAGSSASRTSGLRSPRASTAAGRDAPRLARASARRSSRSASSRGPRRPSWF